MADVGMIGLMAAGVYGLRLLGLIAPVDRLPEFWRRALRSLPVALLAALVASSKTGASSGEPGRIVALFVAGALVWRTRKLWTAVVSGLVVYWMFGIVGWGV